MRKTLLTIVCLLGIGLVNAQTVTLDFTTNGWGLPEAKANIAKEAASFTNGEYTIQLQGSTSGYYFNADGYLLLGKQDATLTLPAFSFDVKRIEIIGREGASTSTLENIYVGDVAVSTQCTGATGTNVFDIAAEYQAAGNVYVLKIENAKNAQVTYIKVYSTSDNIEDTPSDDPVTENNAVFNAITSADQLKAGRVIIAAENLAATGLVDKSYGYLNTVTVTINDKGNVETAANNAFELEAVEGGYAIKDNYGKYIYMKGTYNSFNTSDTTPTEGGVWTITFNEAGEATIMNVEKSKYIQYSTGYTSFGSYAEAQDGGILPKIYLKEEKADEIVVAVPTFSIEKGIYAEAVSVELKTETNGADIYYTVDGNDPTIESTKYTGAINVEKTTTIKAIAAYTANNAVTYSNVVSAEYIISPIKSYKEVSAITSGKQYLLVSKADSVLGKPVEGSKKYNYLYKEAVTMANGEIKTNDHYAFTIEAVEGGYTIKDAYGRYLYTKDDTYKNFNVSATMPEAGAVWTITFSETGEATITNVLSSKYVQYSAQYNSYGAYPDAQGTLPTLYEEAGDTSVEFITNDTEETIIYDLLGRRVSKPTRGIYIINGKKVVMK